MGAARGRLRTLDSVCMVATRKIKARDEKMTSSAMAIATPARAMEADIGSREEDLRRGEVAPIQRWLAENVHRHGRRLDTIPLVEKATGRGLSTEPFLRYLAPLAGR